ncbi:hypothetical protein DPEC_G00165160 [Dallia pectoralis]|uniref:Uncharacterized protein n=1 Tax=Dallia pectoralis TaxID=75939 RepID=A0ACC2GHE6_DALPE|nr:hypothetical protein DPEC_G00165160 [Dallia pectoralis]
MLSLDLSSLRLRCHSRTRSYFRAHPKVQTHIIQTRHGPLAEPIHQAGSLSTACSNSSQGFRSREDIPELQRQRPVDTMTYSYDSLLWEKGETAIGATSMSLFFSASPPMDLTLVRSHIIRLFGLIGLPRVRSSGDNNMTHVLPGKHLTPTSVG